jgi:hypothetical protein
MKTEKMRVLIAIAVFSVLALLMNASNISRIAERTTPEVLRPGVREVLSVARTLSEKTRLERVRETFSDLRDLVRGGQSRELSSGGSGVYLLGGDSVMEDIAPAFADVVRQSGASVEEYIQRGSEVGDPFVDWGDGLEKVVRERNVDVVILLTDVRGSNLDEAVANATALVLQLQRAGVKDVVWLERPAVRNAEYEAGRQFRRDVLMETQRRVDGLRILDPGSALVSSQGGYSSYIVREDGMRVRVRDRDGVHLTAEGARIVAQSIADQLGV